MLEELRKTVFVFMFYNLRGKKSGLRRTIRLVALTLAVSSWYIDIGPNADPKSKSNFNTTIGRIGLRC